MIIYKAFEPGFICRGYHYKGIGEKNVTDEANCVANGFHGSENPLCCVEHYGHKKDAVYCLCKAGGDMDEDNVDDKIACTELTILQVLSREELARHAILYAAVHPNRKKSRYLCRDISDYATAGISLAYGYQPKAKAGSVGDVIGLAVLTPTKTDDIIEYVVETIDGEYILPDTYYGVRELKEAAYQRNQARFEGCGDEQ